MIIKNDSFDYSLQSGRRSKSPYLYEEPLSDREGWWRSTLKVWLRHKFTL